MKYQFQRYLFLIILLSLGLHSHGETHDQLHDGFWEVKENAEFQFITEEETETETEDLHELDDKDKIEKGDGGDGQTGELTKSPSTKPSLFLSLGYYPFATAYHLKNLQTNNSKVFAFETTFLDRPNLGLFLLFHRFKLDPSHVIA